MDKLAVVSLALVIICWVLISGVLLNISLHIIIPDIIKEISLRYTFALSILYLFIFSFKKLF